MVKRSIRKAKPALKGHQIMLDTAVEVAGEDAGRVVKYLKDKQNISEFRIADATKYEVARIRSMLYKLHEYNLVTYYRKKDRKKGWYISYWTLNPASATHIQKNLRKQRIELLQDRLVKEEEYENLFYICRNFCSRMDFEVAADKHFKCPECGELVAHQDNSKTILNIRARLQELKSG